jgi:UDP-N-acetyl-D-mannosaminuronic acid dehydrogenase
VLKRGAVVVIESTVAPATCVDIVTPLLEHASGMRVNDGFFVAACPERVMPGRLLNNLRTISRVLGVSSPAIAEPMRSLYGIVTTGDVDVADTTTAELVKTVENAYRDVNIAFANEVARICADAGADVYRVRELVNKSPGRLMLIPGAGVGGHCIPKDPWLLAAAARAQTPVRMISAARAINESMPEYVCDLLADKVAPQTGARIAVLGYSYLEDSDDIRHSPSEALIQILRSRGYDVSITDPWVAAHAGDVRDAVSGCAAIVIMVGHQDYSRLDYSDLLRRMTGKVIIDTRNVLRRRYTNDALSQLDADITILGVGKR